MTPGVVDGVDVDAVAAAVTGCAGVASLDAGSPVDSVVTYLPGRRVAGVRVTDEVVAVQVAMRWGASVGELGTQIRRALASLVGSRALDIRVRDVTDPVRELPSGTAGATPPAAAPVPGDLARSVPSGQQLSR